MKITVEWLRKENACESGVVWFKKQKKSDHEDVINSLMEENHFDWANWTIVQLMAHPQKIRYAIFAAEQVIEIYEKKYPDDKRPRKAIEAAKSFLKDPSDKNKKAAYTAYAAYAANAADAAVDNAAATYAARNKLQKKIIEFGLKILEVKP